MLRHEPFLEEAARRGAEHPLGQDPLVGYLTLHAVDHALQFGPDSIPSRHVADKVLTETLLLRDESPCKKAYYGVLDALRGGASWEAVGVWLSQLAGVLEGEGRYAEAEDVFRTLAEMHELPGVAAECGEPACVDALLGCARTLRKQTALDEAEGWYGKARERARAAQLADQEASARVGLARLAIERGNYPKAQEILGEIQRDFVDVPLSAHSRGSILHEMATAIRYKDRTHALRVLWEAFETYEHCVDREWALFDIANELLELGLSDPARKAFEVLERYGTPERVGVALRGLLELSWRTENRLLFKRVWTKLSHDLYKLAPALRAEVSMHAGYALRGFGEEERGRELLEKAKALAETFGVNEVLIRADELSAAPAREIASPVGETDDAIEVVSDAVDSLWRRGSLVPSPA